MQINASRQFRLYCSPKSFSYRGSYFKLGGEGSQVLWILCGAGLSHRESLEVSSGVCRGQGSAVTQGVVGGVVWCV